MKLIPLALIAGLAIATVWLGFAVVKLENYRYANFVGASSARIALRKPKPELTGFGTFSTA